MPKNNNDFFKEKKDWSETKDKLLAAYLEPYLQKILRTNKPVLYIDCFAGKGKFEDGKPGSPVIALDIRNRVLERNSENTITVGFIEANHAEDLKTNISGYFPKGVTLPVLSGKYEDNISNILSRHKGKNIFLYIDPYGIKALDFNLFARFRTAGFSSIELLINMNTFGFLREACVALKAKVTLEDFSDELIEYDPTLVKADDASKVMLNTVAGGDYWQQIITDFNSNKIDFFEAEKRFSDAYKRKLQEKYDYVLDIPLRLKTGGRALYRLIHASGHKDACILMADNMIKRAQEHMLDVQKEPSLFAMDVENQIVNTDGIKDTFYEFLRTFQQEESVDIVVAKFFTEYGVCCSSSDIKQKILSDMETCGKIIVNRNPATTNKGKPTTFWEEKDGKTVKIRRAS